MRKNKKKSKKADLDTKNIQPGHGDDGESETIEEGEGETIEVWIKDIIRVKDHEMPIIKKSYAAWAKQWE